MGHHAVFGLGSVVMLFFGCFGLLGTVLWIWMLIDCATKETDQGNTKLVWILVIIFTHLLGALLYLLIRRPARIRELGH
ncbi:MAG TPA: PLDc N-terminal domain-containing protein [Verrucomicrobiae bacterium]